MCRRKSVAGVAVVFMAAGILQKRARDERNPGHDQERIHVGLTQQQMRRVVGTLLVLVGITLIARALG